MRKTGFYLSSVHLLAFIGTVLYTTRSSVEQASLIWLVWFPVDLPWSFLHLVGGAEYSQWLGEVTNVSSVLGYVLYTPYLVHGIIGTIWWFYLPKIVSSVLDRSKDTSRKTGSESNS